MSRHSPHTYSSHTTLIQPHTTLFNAHNSFKKLTRTDTLHTGSQVGGAGTHVKLLYRKHWRPRCRPTNSSLNPAHKTPLCVVAAALGAAPIGMQRVNTWQAAPASSSEQQAVIHAAHVLQPGWVGAHQAARPSNPGRQWHHVASPLAILQGWYGRQDTAQSGSRTTTQSLVLPQLRAAHSSRSVAAAVSICVRHNCHPAVV